MDFLPLILTISSVHTFHVSRCNLSKIGDRFYYREVLWGNLGRPCNLHFHRTTNTLFFSTGSNAQSDINFQIAYYNMATKEYQIIAGIRDGCTLAIDANDDIYMGGSDGIYNYNLVTGIADYYKEKGHNIWELFYRRSLFYISYPEQTLYMEFQDKFIIVKEFQHFEIDHFYISEKGEIYFANKTGLYRYDKINQYVDIISEMISVRQIVGDLKDNVYIVTNFGIYLDNIEGLTKILDLKNVFGLAFDMENHFLISNDTCIIKLYPITQNCDSEPLMVN